MTLNQVKQSETDSRGSNGIQNENILFNQIRETGRYHEKGL